ncbi:MAG: DUF5765 domain-containing protein [Tabrizicola sp.]|uniref:DUF5765 domain-containing protein n=1 Tax=Tabrizicola sp. TaxID=2005166 RepID=UPI002737682E|nr:DUF5765 domain-containing protein [Tabrizicola sp.]MDP3263904.1 DUF5765 domain-containing protein [Tabrizicola sp.]MDP3647268.1 DUF5765 domain-containing protein [Paracoccaceae bacterium]MDZ4068603.1 DUF5765 domain-containing protein [Tabrizicola sp.]
MCWGIEATAGMIVVGVAVAGASAWRGDPVAVPLTVVFFAGMEVLQLAGYMVIDQCGTPANEAVTALSMLHIALQPIVINLFLLAWLRPDISDRDRRRVMILASVASVLMVIQMLPWPGLDRCDIGQPLCGELLCTASGTWHLAWTLPYSDIFAGPDRWLGTNFGFPAYVLAVFVMPLFYGLWRFVLFHALVGPIASNLVTDNPNEAPAIWCLVALLIIGVVLVPGARGLFSARRAAPA